MTISPLQNRRLWIAEIIFTFIFLIFLKSQRMFLNCSLLTCIILGFLLQSYKFTEVQSLWISDSRIWCTKRWKNNSNKIDKKIIKKHHRYFYWVSHWLGKIHSPRPLRHLRPPKVTANLKICKNIQSKTKKQNQETKTKKDIIRHIKELFGHIHSHLEPCVTLAYLELWYIQNPDIFRIRSIFQRTLAYS